MNKQETLREMFLHSERVGKKALATSPYWHRLNRNYLEIMHWCELTIGTLE